MESLRGKLWDTFRCSVCSKIDCDLIESLAEPKQLQCMLCWRQLFNKETIVVRVRQARATVDSKADIISNINFDGTSLNISEESESEVLRKREVFNLLKTCDSQQVSIQSVDECVECCRKASNFKTRYLFIEHCKRCIVIPCPLDSWKCSSWIQIDLSVAMTYGQFGKILAKHFFKDCKSTFECKQCQQEIQFRYNNAHEELHQTLAQLEKLMLTNENEETRSVWQFINKLICVRWSLDRLK